MVQKQKIKLSQHSIQRISERLEIENAQELVNNAWVFGKSIKYFKGDIKKYIYSKMGYMTNGKYRIVIYKSIVFIFTAQNPMLITCYKLPEELR